MHIIRFKLCETDKNIKTRRLKKLKTLLLYDAIKAVGRTDSAYSSVHIRPQSGINLQFINRGRLNCCCANAQIKNFKYLNRSTNWGQNSRKIYLTTNLALTLFFV